MIYIVVPIYNRLELTKKFYKSLLMQNLDFKLILIDDGSQDGTFEWFANSDHCTLIKGSGKLFWGGAMNLGINWLKSNITLNDVVIFANNDVFLEPLTLAKMLKKHAQNAPCVYSPISIDESTLVVKKTGTVYKSWFFTLSKHPFQNQRYEDIGDKNLINCDLMTARFLIISSEIILSVSEIDWRSFPHYGADDDFILSAKKLGFKIFLDPNYFVKLNDENKVHRKQQSLATTLFSIRSSSNIKNKYNLGKKHLPFFSFVGFTFFGLCKSILVWMFKP